MLIGHPFDTIKVIMQTSQVRLSFMSVLRQSSVSAGDPQPGLTHPPVRQVSSLYQGIKAPLSGLAAINAVVFGVHGSIMRLCPNETPEQRLAWTGLAGSSAGVVQSLVTSPMELVKTRAQLSSYSEMQIARHILEAEGGLRGLYRGFWITLARDCPAFATYFCAYEYLLRVMRGPRESPSTLHMLLAGGTAGALSWLVVYPLDVIKSRLQASLRYTSTRHCARAMVQQEGVSVLMRGCGTTLVRAFPTNAATFAVVTWTLYYYETIVHQRAKTKLKQHILE